MKSTDSDSSSLPSLDAEVMENDDSERIESFKDANWDQVTSTPREFKTVNKIPSLVQRGIAFPDIPKLPFGSPRESVMVRQKPSLADLIQKNQEPEAITLPDFATDGDSEMISPLVTPRGRKKRVSRMKKTNFSWDSDSSRSRTRTVNMATGEMISPSPVARKVLASDVLDGNKINQLEVTIHKNPVSPVPSVASSIGSLSPGPRPSRPGAIAAGSSPRNAKESRNRNPVSPVPAVASSIGSLSPGPRASQPGAVAERSGHMNVKEYLGGSATSSQALPSFRKMPPPLSSIADDMAAPLATKPAAVAEHSASQKYMLRRNLSTGEASQHDDGPEFIIDNDSRIEILQRSTRPTTPETVRMQSASAISRSASSGTRVAEAPLTSSLAQPASNIGDDPRFRDSPRGVASSSRPGLLPTNHEDTESIWSNESSGSLKPGVVAISREGEELFYGSNPKGQFTRHLSSQAMLNASNRNVQTTPAPSARSVVGGVGLTADVETPSSPANDQASQDNNGISRRQATSNFPKSSSAMISSCSKTKIIAFALLSVIVVGAAVGVVLSQGSSPTPHSPMQNDPTVAPTAAPRDIDRFNEILEMFKPLSGEAVLQDPTSPQFRAVEWLTFDDQAQLETSDDELEQRYLLAVLYFSMTGENWVDSTKFLSGGSSCDWKGITCDTTSTSGSRPTVVAIQLVQNNLKGTIPREIFNFSSLQRLGLAGNHISSTLPEEIGSLTNLVEIGLESNELEGAVPTSIGSLSNLAILSLSQNAITGTLPTQIGRLTNLQSLLMQTCDLEALPSEMEGLTMLNRIDLGDNLLEGSIPAWLSRMTQLVELKLDFNQLSSSIPTQLGNLGALEILWLNDNDITGQVPTELKNLLKLEDVKFQQTMLSGDVNGIFCMTDNSPQILTADCAGVNPKVNCTCCSCVF